MPKTVDPDEKRKINLSVWMSQDEHAAITACAEDDDDPPSTWLRKLGLREARSRGHLKVDKKPAKKGAK